MIMRGRSIYFLVACHILLPHCGTSAIHTASDHDGTNAADLVTNSVWKKVIERTTFEEASSLRPRGGRGGATSKHQYNGAFPAQVFENVCLEFTSEGASHYLRGSSPFWVPQRGATRLVVLKGNMDIPKGQTQAVTSDSGTKKSSSLSSWPVPRQLPQVFSAAVEAGADVTADNGTWVSVDWDTIPPHA